MDEFISTGLEVLLAVLVYEKSRNNLEKLAEVVRNIGTQQDKKFLPISKQIIKIRPKITMLLNKIKRLHFKVKFC